MQIKVYNGINLEKLFKVVPQNYAALLLGMPSDISLNVVVFPNNKVILSGHVKKAIRRTEEKNDLKRLFLGHCFTTDSKYLMDLNGISFTEVDNFNWTDESYINICQKNY